MNGCTYIDRKTGEPIAWTSNYNSKIMRFWLEKKIDVIITEEEFWKHKQRLINWLVEQGEKQK